MNSSLGHRLADKARSTVCAIVTFVVLQTGWLSQAFANPCDVAAKAAAQASGVSLDLLLAITRVETGRGRPDDPTPWPWSVNVSGQSYWFSTQTEAIHFVEDTLKSGRSSIDIGCFQINVRWHGHHFDSIEAMFDPAENAAYAAEHLVTLYKNSQDWKVAVGAYHSRTPKLAFRYRERVEALLASVSSTEVQQSRPQTHQTEGATAGHGSLVRLTYARGQALGLFNQAGRP